MISVAKGSSVIFLEFLTIVWKSKNLEFEAVRKSSIKMEIIVVNQCVRMFLLWVAVSFQDQESAENTHILYGHLILCHYDSVFFTFSFKREKKKTKEFLIESNLIKWLPFHWSPFNQTYYLIW